MVEAGLDSVHVSPRMVYVDSSRPQLVDGVIRKTFTAMIEGVRESAIKAGIVEPEVFDAGIRALYRTAEADGVFCYTFFKAWGMFGRLTKWTSGTASWKRRSGCSPRAARMS
jgi:hypothetical protein